MSRYIIAAVVGFACLTAMPVQAAPQQVLPYPVAKDGTTNIADCGKVAISFRNECISHSRPVSGKELYAQAAAAKALAAKQDGMIAAKAAKAAALAKAAEAKVAKVAAHKAAKAKSVIPAQVASASKGFKIGRDGTTNVADCAKAAPSVRNECISRARPMTGKELAKFVKDRAVVMPPVAKVAAVKAAVVAMPVAAAAVAKPVIGKGFKISKDGTTDIADCAKAHVDFRNECISRARPVSGKEIYASLKTKS
jgi:hypothetical protein